MSLIKNRKKYELRDDSLNTLEKLELKYNPDGKKEKNKGSKKKAAKKAA